MDIVQRATSLMRSLVERIRSIAEALAYNYTLLEDEESSISKVFWIFNW